MHREKTPETSPEFILLNLSPSTNLCTFKVKVHKARQSQEIWELGTSQKSHGVGRHAGPDSGNGESLLNSWGIQERPRKVTPW